ncbi:hypothetical protein [Photobacterium leiognathi]|uniref:hypothetical protein n=1 Tax=Photobacterium leiognathi TaxID=553611 RepID=UPI002980DB33|nr:hypothetical protein [Photobacterium leiognathi]
MKYQLVALAISSTLLIGCASTDTKESVIEPVANQPTKSKAYNIAAQTILTRPYKVGFETIDSPLKDFTKAEVEDAKTKLTRNVGSASKFFGTLSILTGNLTGVIDVVGGTVASISTSDHPASKPRWIVAVDKSKFDSEKEAEQYITDTITKNAVETLNEYGLKTVETPIKQRKRILNRIDIDTNGKKVPFGLITSNLDTQKVFDYPTTLIDGNIKEAYTVGLNDNSSIYKTLIGSPSIVFANVELKKEKINVSEFYKSLTARLPKGFYLYMPSFNVENYNGMTYTDISSVVPAIYTQGEQYEFIQGM